jgi:hypothetical protein
MPKATRARVPSRTFFIVFLSSSRTLLLSEALTQTTTTVPGNIVDSPGKAVTQMPHWRTKCIDAKVLVFLDIFREPSLGGQPDPAIWHLTPFFHRIKEQTWNIGDGNAICG